MAVLDNYEIREKLSNCMADVPEIAGPEDFLFIGYVDGEKVQRTFWELKDESRTLELGCPSNLYKAYLEALSQGLTVLRDWKIHKIYNSYVVEGTPYNSEESEGFVISKFDWPFIITKAGTRVLIDFEY